MTDTSTLSSVLASNGQELPTGPDVFGTLEDSSGLVGDPGALRQRMEREGYLYLKGLLDRDAVAAAREEILFKFAIVGEIDSTNHPLMDGILSTRTWIDQVNLLAFTESLRRGMAYSNIVDGQRILDFFTAFLGGPARSFDFRWPRFMRLGEATGIHCDGPYISRGTKHVWSAWVPLGDIPLDNGPIMLLERSHTNESLAQDYLTRDADRDKIGWLSKDPVALREQLGGRWLSVSFEMGDVLVFGPAMVHASLDNNSQQRRCRLSSDTRYQLASEPLDERYNGPGAANPHGGPQRAFLPGRAPGNNEDFQEEWKRVDEWGRLLTAPPTSGVG